MIFLACLASAALAAFLWASAPSLPHGPALRLASAAASFASLALAAGGLRALRRAAPGCVRLRRVPCRSGEVYAGVGYEWLLRDAERSVHAPDAPWRRDRAGDLFLPLPLLDQHALILGTTGTGKTRLLEILILQAVARGEAVAIVDPKGDERLLDVVRLAALRAGRTFRYFSLPEPGESIRYNPIGHYLQTREVADRVAAVLPSQGEAQAFRNYGWEVVDTVARALEEAGEPVTFPALRRYAIESPDALVKLLRKRGKRCGELDALACRPRDHYLKMVSALVPVLTRLAGCEALAPGWSWEQGAAGREVAYFFLGSLLGAETANSVAKMALLDFQSFVGKRYVERRTEPFSLFVDELGDVLTPEFVNILNKARGAGVRVTACAQTAADFEAALGSRARALQVVGNASTVFQFRAQSVSDAEAFGELAGRRMMAVPSEGEIYEPALFGSGHRDIDDFRAAFSRQFQPVEMPLVPPASVMSLPTFHYFARWGGRLHRGLVPLVDYEVAGDLDPDPRGGGDGGEGVARRA